MGSALSTLAVPKVIEKYPNAEVKHYNFASPRVASPQFTEKYNGNGVLSFRVVNTCDVVPTAIFGQFLYQHIATLVNFTGQYGSIENNHDPKNYQYALKHPNNPML